MAAGVLSGAIASGFPTVSLAGPLSQRALEILEGRRPTNAIWSIDMRFA